MAKMAKGEHAEFEEAFRFACPKFLSPVSPNYDNLPGGNSGKEPYLQQLNVFKDEVAQQIALPTIRCVHYGVYNNKNNNVITLAF